MSFFALDAVMINLSLIEKYEWSYIPAQRKALVIISWNNGRKPTSLFVKPQTLVKFVITTKTI